MDWITGCDVFGLTGTFVYLNVEVVLGLSPHQMMDECVMNIFTLSHFSLSPGLQLLSCRSHVGTQVYSCSAVAHTWELKSTAAQLSLTCGNLGQQMLSCLLHVGT
jgi:hypothetical protein